VNVTDAVNMNPKRTPLINDAVGIARIRTSSQPGLKDAEVRKKVKS